MFARSLQTMGLDGAALALLAQNANVAAALKAAGVVVPGSTAVPLAKANASKKQLPEATMPPAEFAGPVSITAPEILAP